MAAIVAMKQINTKKLKSELGNPAHAKAPGFKRKWLINQFIGVVILKTNTTAIPNPEAVLIFLEHAKNEHIPRNKDKRILLMNMDSTAKLNKCSTLDTFLSF